MEKSEANEGVIKAFYTLNGWFVKVKQFYMIDRVCFSFVKKGTKGDGFDVYVGVDQFDNLCDDILSGAFAQALAQDNGPYPSAWKHVSGQNGQREVAIGKGRKQPAVIQGRDKVKNQNAFVGIMDYGELRTMAKWHRRVSRAYYEERAAACAAAQVHKPKEETVPVTLYTAGVPEQISDSLYRIPAYMEGKSSYLYLNRNSLDYLGGGLDQFLYMAARKQMLVSMAARVKDNNYLLVGDLAVRQ